jgi:hypothetical protein
MSRLREDQIEDFEDGMSRWIELRTAGRETYIGMRAGELESEEWYMCGRIPNSQSQGPPRPQLGPPRQASSVPSPVVAGRDGLRYTACAQRPARRSVRSSVVGLERGRVQGAWSLVLHQRKEGPELASRTGSARC